jgi:hypothetical protein
MTTHPKDAPSGEPEQIVVGCCPTCGGMAQAIAHADGEVGHRALRQDVSHAAMQDDVAATLRALGISDHARPVSPHQVMQDEVLPALAALREREKALVEVLMAYKGAFGGIDNGKCIECGTSGRYYDTIGCRQPCPNATCLSNRAARALSPTEPQDEP